MVMRHQEGIGASHTRVDVIHHGKDTRPLQVQVGIYVYDGVTAYFHQIVRRLQMELLDTGCIGRCVVLGGAAYFDTWQWFNLSNT